MIEITFHKSPKTKMEASIRGDISQIKDFTELTTVRSAIREDLRRTVSGNSMKASSLFVIKSFLRTEDHPMISKEEERLEVWHECTPGKEYIIATIKLKR